eukprot:GHVQ01009286.1.p2 GENE.GHVQ01009286.1~~GHVQ01009286.1.p2  ORF type:complete len:159 (-),score=15.21 GHVQ01009286.1:4706-5182(-)
MDTPRGFQTTARPADGGDSFAWPPSWWRSRSLEEIIASSSLERCARPKLSTGSEAIDTALGYGILALYFREYIQALHLRECIQAWYLRDCIQALYLRDCIQALYLRDCVQALYLRYCIQALYSRQKHVCKHAGADTMDTARHCSMAIHTQKIYVKPVT